MPILATIFLLWDWIYFIGRTISGPDTAFLHDPEFFGGFLAVIVLVIEALLYRDILVLLHQLVDLSEEITDTAQGKGT